MTLSKSLFQTLLVAALAVLLSSCALTVRPANATLRAAVVTDADACKDGGWRSLTRADGSAFQNQGQCVSYANGGG